MNSVRTFFKWIKNFLRSGHFPFDVEEVESTLGYHFNDRSFLFKSLKHRSYSQSVDGTTNLSNERLEFLGDSVLSMIVSHHLFTENPDFQEGDLTKLKSSLVNKKSEAIAARKIGLNRYILLNESEENAGGRHRSSIIADTLEAIIGAIFLDGGYTAAEDFIRRTILDNQNILLDETDNHKSLLLELVQSKKIGFPVYNTISESGPDHDKVFSVEVKVKGETIGKGKGKSKKAAQQIAAKIGFENIKKRLYL